jgi:chromate reductase
MEIASIADMPLYNADLDTPAASSRPPIVQRFRDLIAKADGLVIVSPEYNYSIPGGLKMQSIGRRVAKIHPCYENRLL